MGMGLFPGLKLTHLIPKERIDEEYLLRIAEGIHISLFVLRHKWLGIAPPSDITVIGLLRFIRNFYRFRGIRRRMYLAEVRAAKIAKKMIDVTGSIANVPSQISDNVSPCKRQH
jgi:hypothetical protein